MGGSRLRFLLRIEICAAGMADAGAACRGGQGAVVGGDGERVGHQAAFRVGDQHPQLEGAAIACGGGEGADGFLRQRHVEGGDQAQY